MVIRMLAMASDNYSGHESLQMLRVILVTTRGKTQLMSVLHEFSQI